jgi:hypothetical protein
VVDDRGLGPGWAKRPSGSWADFVEKRKVKRPWRAGLERAFGPKWTGE